MILFLTGLPGSGKTTLGKSLAEQLGFAFVDLDFEIEKTAQKTIPEIFETDGEDVFRIVEKQTLHRFLNNENTIVSTGGGAPCFFDNLNQMLDHGIVVFIDVSSQELYNRLYAMGVDSRPLLRDKGDSLLKEIELKRDQRLPYYQKAHIVLSGDQLLVDDLLVALKKHSNSKD